MPWFKRRHCLPVKDVTREEFMKIAVEAGFSTKEAERLAAESQGKLLDGHMKIGDEFLQVVASKPSSNTT